MGNIQIKKESMIVKEKDDKGVEVDKELEYLSIKVKVKTNLGETDVKMKVNPKDKSLLMFLLSQTPIDKNGNYLLGGDADAKKTTN